MTTFQSNSLGERDVEQAIIALKRGSHLLKYGRRGKPKVCLFRLSNDEASLIWYSGKREKQVQLKHVTKIIPGQRTAVFHRYPRPEKEYQSFSLICCKRSLDLICKDKDETEIWFVALKALLARGSGQTRRRKKSSDSVSSDGSSALTQRFSQSFLSSSSSDIEPKNTKAVHQGLSENPPQRRLGRAFSEFSLYDSAAQFSPQRDAVPKSLSLELSGRLVDEIIYQTPADTFQCSLSSTLSSSSLGSPLEDHGTLGDVIIWGQGIGDGLLGGGVHRIRKSPASKMDALFPKVLKSILVLDTQKISCGSKHAVLVTKQGEIFSWGEGTGGRLGHGVEADVSNPKSICALSGLNIESVACGENHTCAVTLSGDLYTWGDGIHNFGLLGHGNEFSHWVPKRVRGQMEYMHVTFISCGPWHSAAVTSGGLLFTFGDGTFGALGHGDRCSTSVPREVETLKGLQTMRVSCGVWHTAAIVEITSESSTGNLFTWGDGSKGQLGHGNEESRLVPSCVEMSNDENFCQVACGNSITVALTTLGQVYTMGSADYGQLGSPGSPSKLPVCIEGEISNNFIEEIACGSHHVAVLSSKSEVYTWGKGTNGQLGHGDIDDRNTPTFIEALRGKQVKSVACGSNFTAVICLHKQVGTSDHYMCSGCKTPFNFRRKRHNCYNCGLVFCKDCSSKKSLKASLAPNVNKHYRVCEVCFVKLNKDVVESRSNLRPPKVSSGITSVSSGEMKDQETTSDVKPQGLLSRLSSFDSFKRLSSRHSMKSRKQDLNNGQVSPIQNGSFRRESSGTSNSSTSMYDGSQNLSPLPGSTRNSLTSFPISIESSPTNSMSLPSNLAALATSEVVLDDSERTHNCSKEISILKEQVGVLARRSQVLEAELGRTSKQLKEATDFIREERVKNKAAKEVIKSLTTQLRDMAVKISQGSSFCRISGSFAENSTSGTLSLTSTWNKLTS